MGCAGYCSRSKHSGLCTKSYEPGKDNIYFPDKANDFGKPCNFKAEIGISEAGNPRQTPQHVLHPSQAENLAQQTLLLRFRDFSTLASIAA
jgi:hypothetical protein